MEEHQNREARAKSGRNVIIAFDGTDNEFGEINTNVVRLVQTLDRDPRKQRLYYDPGVGTMAEPGAYGFLKKWMSKIAGLAFGAGLDWKVQEAYAYLMDMWEPGDQVFLFGFSRGAYSARVLAGLLYTVGLLPRGNQNLLPYAMGIFKGLRDNREGDATAEWKKLCADFRWTFSRPARDGDSERHFPVHFLGVWDTVSSVGWIWDPEKFPYTARNPGISTIRHAVSIDERRWFFRQNLMKQAAPDQDLVEMWFSGVHCDVGGGYPQKLEGEYAELWRQSFGWILSESMKAGLLIDPQRMQIVLDPIPDDPRPWTDKEHNSLAGAWFIAEYVPKQVWDSKAQKRKWAVGGCGYRSIEQGALIHKSVLRRMRTDGLNYSPQNMSESFKETVAKLSNLPEQYPYSA